MSLGILVYGDNHLILRGPRPACPEARALAAHFGLSLAQISPRLDQTGQYRDQDRAWRISVREFRENLQWAVCLLASTQPSQAVSHLLAELAARGVAIDRIEESACVVS